jgi:hypothetical protein
MRYLCFIIASLVCLAVLGVVPALCEPEPRVEELEQKCIRYRLENTKRGYVRMHVSDEIDPQQQTERLYEITFDEKRIRQVRRCRLLGNKRWGEPEKIIVTPKAYIDDSEYVQTPVQMAPVSNYKEPREHLRVLNPQLLGMDLGGVDMLHFSHVEMLLNRSNRTPPTVQLDELAGLKTWRIDYKLKENGAEIKVWIVPDQGFSVVRAEAHTVQKNGERLVEATDSPLKQYPVGDIWYPRTVFKTLKRDGQVIKRQVVTIEEARFGGPIDDTAFTPTGLDLKPGREIVDSTSGLPWRKVWDGKKLVDPSAVKTNPPNPERHRRPRWLQLTLAACLGLIAAFYFWRAFRRRSASNTGA